MFDQYGVAIISPFPHPDLSFHPCYKKDKKESSTKIWWDWGKYIFAVNCQYITFIGLVNGVFSAIKLEHLEREG